MDKEIKNRVKVVKLYLVVDKSLLRLLFAQRKRFNKKNIFELIEYCGTN